MSVSTKRYFELRIILALFLLPACSSMEKSEYEKLRENNKKGEFVYRSHDKHLFETPPVLHRYKEKYPWERSLVGTHLKITKDFFRCNGSSLNPSRAIQEGKETIRIFDCGGVDKHTLPIRDDKEFIYPALIDLLNFVQAKTGKRVVITSGYRCPEHNTYVDSSIQNRSSKHLIGAEVDFYVQGMEAYPEAIAKILMQYYNETSPFMGTKEYQEFERYQKGDTNVSTPPWYNKEIFIKLFKKQEGRNFDNRHPYPYISLQVRYDRDTKQKVNYSWDQANRCYHRK